MSIPLTYFGNKTEQCESREKRKSVAKEGTAALILSCSSSQMTILLPFVARNPRPLPRDNYRLPGAGKKNTQAAKQY